MFRETFLQQQHLFVLSIKRRLHVQLLVIRGADVCEAVEEEEKAKKLRM